MEFRLLGQVEWEAEGRTVPLGPPKQRLVLAALLWRQSAVVGVATLVGRVWGEDPPPTATATLYSYLTRLRTALRDGSAAVSLRRDAAGYRLDVPPDAVDLWRFRRDLRDARGQTDDVRRVALLRRAVDTWRGEPLAGLTGDWADSTRETLGQQRLAALIDLGEAELHQGRYLELISDLTSWLAEHPLAERSPRSS